MTFNSSAVLDSTENEPSKGTLPSSITTLPEGFMSIQQIQELPNEKIQRNTIVNVIGLATDFQAPIQSRGSDHKCTIEIKDASIQFEKYGMKVIMFWSPDKLPRTCGLLDVILIRRFKCQMWGGQISLLASHTSEIYIMAASDVPRSIDEYHRATWVSYPPSLRQPAPYETRCAVQTKLSVHDMEVPSTQTFEARVTQAANVKDKFSLLKDIKPDCYYNLIAQAVRLFDGSGGAVTLYVTDYTANSNFYDYEWKQEKATNGREGDEYGYLQHKNKPASTWPGPFGKLSIQLTLFDAHADFTRRTVKPDDWLLLRNVQIRFGKMGGCVEGYLRGEGDKVNVEVMLPSDQPDENDVRWKAAVGRKRDYWKKFDKQKEKYLREVSEAGNKRKANEDNMKGSYNSKKRRMDRRAAGFKQAATIEAKIREKLDLNENVKCSFPDISTLGLEQIMKPQKHIIDSETKQEVILPFVNGKYRANVRVVGYFPHKVEDFAVGRRITEYDMLSDYSGGEDTDHEEDRRIFKDGKGFGKKKWEWRFALEVEDASSKFPKTRTWIVVDNLAAQGLLDMDAENLRANPPMLSELKERFCILWGDLEEQKSALLKTKLLSPMPPQSSFNELLSSAAMDTSAQPNVDSDDENDVDLDSPIARSTKSQLQQRVSSDGGVVVNGGSANIDPYHPVVKNKAFTCCIRQYGVRVNEEDPSKASAGNGEDGTGKRWERRFGLFGVNIV